MFMFGSTLALVVSLIATKIIKTNKDGAFYMFFGMTIVAFVACLFVKVPKK
mgnify:CR=1 FL=1